MIIWSGEHNLQKRLSYRERKITKSKQSCLNLKQLIVALQSELATLKSVQTESSELRATIEVL